MRTSQPGIDLITEFEGFRASRYLDAVGVPTIGYGTTRADVDPLPAKCTKAQAIGWLKDNVARKYEPAVNGVGVSLSQNQFDALVSFVYNCGPGAVSASTGIGRALRARNYQQAANELLRWDKAGGRALAGLTRRRQAERKLFLTPGGAAPPDAAPAKPKGRAQAMAYGKMKDGRIEVFEIHNGEVWHRWQKAGGSGQWTNWFSLGVPGG